MTKFAYFLVKIYKIGWSSPPTPTQSITFISVEKKTLKIVLK